MSEEELGQVSVQTLFCWGMEDPFLTPAQAHPSVAAMPAAVLPGSYSTSLVHLRTDTA